QGNKDVVMVADAVAFEPVSTPKFPANREKNREFVHFRSFAANKSEKDSLRRRFQSGSSLLGRSTACRPLRRDGADCGWPGCYLAVEPSRVVLLGAENK
ncbi:MAG: hypothetical protein WCC80_13735, partial [Pseudolabrys sp.]